MESWYKLTSFATDTQSLIALLIGMVIQFFLGDKRTARVAFMVILSSIFVSLYIVRPILMYLHVAEKYEYLIPPAYALSTVISIQILAILIRIFPPVLAKKIEKMMGVDNDIKR